jgi:hypothetical protein
MKTLKKGCPNVGCADEELGVEELEPRLAPFFDIFVDLAKSPSAPIALK